MTDHMRGNPHYSMSLPDAAATGDGRAIANATLALAYEQRTANLLGVLNARWANGAAMFPREADEPDVRQDILRSLGLEKEWEDHHGDTGA